MIWMKQPATKMRDVLCLCYIYNDCMDVCVKFTSVFLILVRLLSTSLVLVRTNGCGISWKAKSRLGKTLPSLQMG